MRRLTPLRGLLAPLAAAAAALVGLPGTAAAHQLNGRFESPLPLAVYLAGAAIAVALSFGLVLGRRELPQPMPEPGPPFVVPRWVRLALTGAGLLGWAWALVVSLLVAVPTDADPGSLFLWVYGWVGLALVSALLGPAWSWLDPFSTLARIAGRVGQALGVGAPASAAYPERLGRWPAVAGLAFFIWLELAVTGGGGGRVLGLALLGYTAVTLGAMLVYGRTTWRAQGETFSVWFELIGRLAPLVLDGPPEAGRLRRRRFTSGLFRGDWRAAELALVALAVAGVIFDGLSQTDVWFNLLGEHSVASATVQLAVFAGVVIGLALLVSRVSGRAAVGAGLVPIATGYIIAHYLTLLLIDGQRIIVVLDDPFGQGWHWLGLAGWQPSGSWLPPPAAWAAMFAAVVGGHVVGALSGHGAAALEAAAEVETLGEATALRRLRRRELPLACLMVGLTVLTLWSLGQQLVRPAT